MIQTPIGRSGLSVPDQLLRVHETVGERVPTPATARAPVPSPALREPATPTRLALTLCVIAAAGSAVDGAIVGGASHLVRDLHTTRSGVFALLVVLGATRLVAASVLVPRPARRWRVVCGMAILAAAGSAGFALTGDIGPAVGAAVIVGIGTAVLSTSHLTLVTQRGWHAASRAAGFVVAALVATANWHVAAILGVLAVIPAAAGWRDQTGDAEEPGHNVVARLTRLRSKTALSAILGLLGFVTVGLPPVAQAYLHNHHQTAVLTAAGVAAVVGALAAPRGATAAVLALVGAAVGLGLAGVDWQWGLVLAAAGLAAAAVTTANLVAAIVPRSVLERTFAIAGFVAVFWALTGAVVASAARSAWGSDGVLLATGAATAAIAALVALNRDAIDEDAAAAGATGHAPSPSAGTTALQIDGVGFAYGTQPVLFDIGLTVAEGEIAALLGTNGAGKSTLLRLVAGLDHPNRGTIHLFGEDTTYLDAEQVLGHGVALLSGGRMTFPGLTVAENIRVGTQKAAERTRAEQDAFEAFPILYERRNQRAGTLSGGEQQMLALARVLVMRPRLLLLDELTLGLAPRIIEQLLATVRTVNERGATIVLVEQSANLALTIADHAFFMERGAVRFDGRPDDLRGRDDLLRPVFLG